MVERNNRLSGEYPQPVSRFTEEPSSFQRTGVPSYYYSADQSAPSFPTHETHEPSNQRVAVHAQSPLSESHVVFAARHSTEHARASTDSTRPLSHSSNRNSIQRKPLPGAHTSNKAHEPQSPETISSVGSLRMDPEGFAKIGRQNSNMSVISSAYNSEPLQPKPNYSRNQSTESRPSFEMPRSGMMRTVGGTSEDVHQGRSSNDIPSFDFGPTINYASNPLPKESDPNARERSSDAPYKQQSQPRQPSPRREIAEPQYKPSHQANSGSRTVPWQPGMGTGLGAPQSTPSSTRAMTPEEFVQQRANAATAPQYVHQRQKSSSNTLRTTLPTPPIAQGQRPEYFGHSRNNSSIDAHQRPNSRPGSRGAGATLGGVSETLSAREQQHLSRVTGAPLVNLAGPGNRGGGTAPTGGLVGSIDARAQEKKIIMQGANDRAVQHAFNQRQVHGQYQPQPQGQLPLLPPHVQQQGYAPQYPQQYSNQENSQAYAGPQGGGVGMPGSMPGQFPSSPYPSPGVQNHARGGYMQSQSQPPARVATPEQLAYQQRVQQQQQFYPSHGQGKGRGGTGPTGQYRM